jgi:hypothetical protein
MHREISAPTSSSCRAQLATKQVQHFTRLDLLSEYSAVAESVCVAAAGATSDTIVTLLNTK